MFGACAGAALYRRDAVLGLGGFDERYFAYLEDVDLALRLRLAGWGCRYEPAVARHAGEGSSHQLSGAHHRLIARNTVMLVVALLPAAPGPVPVLYRQLSWLRDGRAPAAPARAPDRAGAGPAGRAGAARASAVRCGRSRRSRSRSRCPAGPGAVRAAGGHPAQAGWARAR